MNDKKTNLFSEFEAPSTQAWLDKIQVDLKGEDFNKRLVWKTNEGFSVQPFYRKENIDSLSTPDSLPGEFPFVRGNKKKENNWYVRQDISVFSVKEANKKALDILSKGVDSLGFIFPDDSAVDGKAVAALLDGIQCDCIELNFKAQSCKCPELAKTLVSYFEGKGYDKEKLACSIEWNPVKDGMSAEAVLEEGKKLVEAVKDYPDFRVLAVNSLDFCNQGAYIVQELGYALAWGAEYLQQLSEAGVDSTAVARRIKFNMGISENYFMEIAKFRAARLLWAQIVKKFEPKCNCVCKMRINAETSTYNMTLFDSYVNLLRSQTETMSASIAGVDSIVVNPFDKIYVSAKDREEFSERIARNQQLLLKEESHFDKVVDPSAGSYYIEELTNSLANEAWKIFLKVEEEGGFAAAVKSGSVKADIKATDEKRHTQAAQRREFILGTNQFPNFGEKSEGKRPLDIPHLSSDFEAVRIATEAAPKQPVAFMLTIGSLVWRQARAQFSCNYLAGAGYKVVDNLGFSTVEEGVDAALKAGADIVVLCSSDDEYAQYAVPAYQYLAGRALFIVAGCPACIEDLKAAGIENFIHVKTNQLETLKMLNEKLGL